MQARDSIIPKHDPVDYSALQVLKADALEWWYIGTTYTDPATKKTTPCSRESDYFSTQSAAVLFLEKIKNGDKGALAKLVTRI